MEKVVKVVTRGTDIFKTCVHRFNDLKMAREFARLNGTKVERTGNSFVKYCVVIAGKGIRPWDTKDN